mgnify:CR=1 FL=1
MPIVNYEEWCPKCNVKWKYFRRNKKERDDYDLVLEKRFEIYCKLAKELSGQVFDSKDNRQASLAFNVILHGKKVSRIKIILRKILRFLGSSATFPVKR